MLHDYLALNQGADQIEIANLDRWLTYGRLLTGSAWQGQNPRNEYFYPAMFGNGGPYTTPAADNAPWYRQGVPESEGFGGLMIESVTGDGGIPLSRQTFPGASGGASFGPGRIGARVHNYRGWLVGASEIHLGYGFEWLSQTLLLGGCRNPLTRPSLTWFAGRPNTRGVECAGITDLETRLPTDWIRVGYDVELTGAPEIIRRWATQTCFSMYEVAFQLTFGNSLVYGARSNIIENLPLDVNPVRVELPCCDDQPNFSPPCFAEPFDPQDLAGQNCWCQPDDVFRSHVTIPPVARRRFAPELVITNGDAVSSNLRVVFYESRPEDANRNINDPADLVHFECERKNAVIEIPYLPAGATFTADARTGEISITTAQGDVITRQVAQGESGAPMFVPSGDGCSDMIVMFETDTENTAAGIVATINRHDEFMTTGN